MNLLVASALALTLGSFVGAWSWRLARGKKITSGRSRCAKCREKIVWYDNLPIVSYVLLKGRCRSCEKTISARYPLIEAFVAATLFLTFKYFYLITENVEWLESLGWIGIPLFLFVLVLLLTIFVVDLENFLVPDNLVFAGLLIVMAALIYNTPLFTLYFLAGLLASLFLLLIHLATLGRGMGLGDVKLALLLGTILGPEKTIVFMLTAFLTGAGVGTILILVSKFKFGQKIPFGPFLILSFLIVSFFGNVLLGWLPAIW